MHVGIAGLMHETHTFLPEGTGLEAFESGATRGEAVVERHRGTNTVIGGFVEAAEAADIALDPVVSAHGGISGTVDDAVYDRYAGEMREGFADRADRLDGVALFLHGAMVTESHRSPERDIVAEVRGAVGPDVPIAVAMDLHGNVGPGMLADADAICAYQSSPHVDKAATGRRAMSLLEATVAGRVSPTMAIAKPGLVVPSPFSATTTSPAKDAVMRSLIWQVKPELHDVTRWADADRVLDVSLFFGFAWADVPQLGVAAVAVTDDDPELATTIVDDVANFVWAHRDGLTNPAGVYGLEAGVAEALDRATDADAPVLLLDAADRLAETTFVLRELMDQGAENVAVPLLCDPESVAACRAAGEGATVELSVGSKTSPRGGGPVDLTATVEWVGHNPYVATGPISQGERVDHGPTAIVRADGVWLQLTTERDTFGLIDTDPIEQYGYETTAFDVVVSKSKTHFRAVFEDLADSIVIVDAPEYSPIDLTHFDYEYAPADLYPLSGY